MPEHEEFSRIQSRVEAQIRAYYAKVSRRKFLQLGVHSLAGLALLIGRSFGLQAQDSAPAYLASLPNGVASGDVSQNSVVLWAHSRVLGQVRFKVSQQADFSQIFTQASAQVRDVMLPVKVFIEGLPANTAYFYRVTDANGASLIGRFRTLAHGGQQGLRFGVAGDWRGELRPYVALSNVLERELDFFVELGDTIYANIPSLDLPRRIQNNVNDFYIKHNEGYSERFGKNYWAEIRAAMPIFATIDDNDVVNDWAGAAAPSSRHHFGDEAVRYVNQTTFYRNALAGFHAYNPIREEIYTGTNDERMENRPKLYRYRHWGQTAAFFLLDTRSFRDPRVESIEFTDVLNRGRIRQFNEDIWQNGRVFLGQTQLETLKRDLLSAHEAGILWKFIILPEPMQLMGWFAGQEHWEGYAPERSAFIQFIEEQQIKNVVFISADVHSTFVNRIYYQTEAHGEFIQTDMWDISTGAVAFYPPTGQLIVESLAEAGLLPPTQLEQYQAGSLQDKDALLAFIFNQLILNTQGLAPIGLDEALADLLQGTYLIGHSFGWTEFDIEEESQALTVTTYGIPAYDLDMLENNRDDYLALRPQVMSQFRVAAKF